MTYYYPKPQVEGGDGASDAALLAECEVNTYRASGPGGQHRNKVESAVRIKHLPTGITVIAEENRLQAANKTQALKRLRLALALRVRHEVPAEGVPEAVQVCIGKDGRLKVGRRDQRYLPCASSLLDVLSAHEGSVSEAATRLGLTTGNLSSFLTDDADLMLEANRLRAGFGLKPLRRT